MRRVGSARALHNGTWALGPISGTLVRQAPPVVGQWASCSRVFDSRDVEAFSTLGADANPIHRAAAAHGDATAADAAAAAGFGGPVVHGLFIATMFPALFAHLFPGAIYRTQRLQFETPAPVGTKVVATITVTGTRALRRGGPGGRGGAVVAMRTVCEESAVEGRGVTCAATAAAADAESETRTLLISGDAEVFIPAAALDAGQHQ